MYLTRIDSANVKLLRDFHLNLTAPSGEPRMWTVLVGENGYGKTTLFGRFVTNHSPMVLPGLRREEIVLLGLDEDGNVVPREPEVSPMLLTGSELYDSFFGINDLEPGEVAEEYRRYAFLVGNPGRTDDEDHEMLTIRSKLASLGLDPGWEPVERKPLCSECTVRPRSQRSSAKREKGF